jgi:cellulose biosynthesis protein BcsQ
LANEVAVDLALNHGKSVLLVDLDPSGNLTLNSRLYFVDLTVTQRQILQCLGPNPDYPFLGRTRSVKAVPGLSVLFQDAVLMDYFNECDSDCLVDLDVRQLGRVLDGVKRFFDFVVVDSPPGLGELPTSALVAADEVLVPVDLRTVDSITGFRSLVRHANSLSEEVQGCDVFMVGNMFQAPRNGSWNDETDNFESLDRNGCPVAATPVTKSSAFSKGRNRGRPVMLAADRSDQGVSQARAEIQSLTEEIVSGGFLGTPFSALGQRKVSCC